MKITCALSDFDFFGSHSDLNVILYGRNGDPSFGSVGATLKQKIIRKKVVAAPAKVEAPVVKS